MLTIERTTIKVPEMAERLGLCDETVYALLKANKIPNLRHGRRFIVSRAVFQRWEQSIGEDRPVASSK